LRALAELLDQQLDALFGGHVLFFRVHGDGLLGKWKSRACGGSLQTKSRDKARLFMVINTPL
jgi:hypothetical protein